MGMGRGEVWCHWSQGGARRGCSETSCARQCGAPRLGAPRREGAWSTRGPWEERSEGGGARSEVRGGEDGNLRVGGSEEAPMSNHLAGARSLT
ncbi:hypothetical protein E2C01_051353 [Portunus trituberculatus]|uniref:Uncharacterized protein n=1 Tax=Portunus trituberculatus TaxID=210409 RepID=A0A5B7GLK7_PORTR|nr:hypothetical protein [Portunus trituberculatus]